MRLLRWVCLLPLSLCAQQDDYVLKVDTRVFQVDAVVLDEHGRQVRDLRAEDFEIVAKGGRNPVRYCSYVPLRESAVPGPLTAERLRRVIAFVVSNPRIDLNNCEHGGTVQARVLADQMYAQKNAHTLLARFVDEEMTPSDLAAIARVDSDDDLLSQLTADREILKVLLHRLETDTVLKSPPVLINCTSAFRHFSVNIDSLVRQNLRAVATLKNALNQIKDLPGRKLLVFCAQFMLGASAASPEVQPVTQALEELAREANQARVSIYTIPLWGLPIAPGMGQDRNPLAFLSGETGGRIIENNNDYRLVGDLLMEESSGYYLLGYPLGDRPAPSGKVRVRVKRPGVRVLARSSGTEAGPAQAAAAAAKLGDTLRSPLARTEIALGLDVRPERHANAQPFLSTDLQIPLKGIEFEPRQDGLSEFATEIAILLLGPDGLPVFKDSKTHMYKVGPGGISKAVADGLRRHYDLELPGPGYYQLRIAVKDPRSGRVGTVSRLLNVPPAG